MTESDAAEARASVASMTEEERQKVAQVLGFEYGVLIAGLSSAWSASLTRTSIFLGVLSAAGVALGFAVQASFDTFLAFAMVVVPLVLLLGLTTFVRTVQLQRESTVYITGLNRIRHFFQESAQASKMYYVLPAHDDEPALYRSQGTGIHVRPPRFRLVLALTQMPGIVAVVCGLLAATIGGFATMGLGVLVAWVVAALCFAVTVLALLMYWRRSLAELRAAIRPINPTPPEEIGGPI